MRRANVLENSNGRQLSFVELCHPLEPDPQLEFGSASVSPAVSAAFHRAVRFPRSRSSWYITRLNKLVRQQCPLDYAALITLILLPTARLPAVPCVESCSWSQTRLEWNKEPRSVDIISCRFKTTCGYHGYASSSFETLACVMSRIISS